MSTSARAGALVYAKDLERLSSFYEQVLDVTSVVRAPDHHVPVAADFELVVHAIPERIASTFTITSPPHWELKLPVVSMDSMH